MKHLTHLLTAMLIAGCVTGCATTPLDHTSGIEISQEKLGTLQKGKTTREEVAAAVGQPPEKKELMGKEVWSYPYTRIAAMPFAKNTSETTVFEFDKGGKLVNAYKSGATAGKSGNPLLDAAGM